MPIDRIALGNKIKRYREQFNISVAELAAATGIAAENLVRYEGGEREPTGDEILVLADHFMCDYKFFVSNEKLTPLDQTEALFRRYGTEISSEDRWAIQEVLYFADNEYFLLQLLGYPPPLHFNPTIIGNNHKNHGVQAAQQLRHFLNHKDQQVGLNIYDEFRSIGLLVYRRKLNNSKISGMCIKHPVIGNCIIVNADEDVYRQRFTAAHEAAHAFLDKQDFVVSFAGDTDFKEVRANAFASNYLMPPNFLRLIPEPEKWDQEKVLTWANKLQVSTTALAYALKSSKLITTATSEYLRGVRVPKHLKVDPELPQDLAPMSRARKEALLDKGLSTRYVTMVFSAFRNDLVSRSRMLEMLRVSESQLVEMADLYRLELVQ